MRPNRRQSSADTLSIRLAVPGGIVAALDAIDDACAEHEPTWEFLKAELSRSPSRGQRVSVQLVLIRQSAVYRLHEERSNAAKRRKGEK